MKSAKMLLTKYFQNFCRTCAIENHSLHDIPDSKKKYYSEFLQAYGINMNYGFEISNKLCSPCLDKLQTCIDFRTQILNADIYFQETLSRLREDGEKDNLHSEIDIDDKSGIVLCVLEDNSDNLSVGEPLQELRNENANLTITPLHICSKCLTTFHSSEHLTQHKAQHNSQTSAELKCPYCTKRFLNLSDIDPHVREMHPNLKYKCGYCNTECDYQRILQLHIGTHLYDKPQDINLNQSSDNDDKLESGGRSRSELNQRKIKKSEIILTQRKIEPKIKEITNEKVNPTITHLHTCFICRTSFHSFAHLKQHKARRSKKSRVLREIVPHVREKHVKYKCGYCNTECNYKRILQLHIGIHLSDTPQEIYLNQSNYNDKQKGVAKQKRKEERIQTKNEKSKIERSKKNIVQNVKCRKPPAVQMHFCRRCDTYFHTFEHLVRHNEKHGTATSEERRTCRYCNNVLTHMRFIASHIRKHHSKDIKYQCGYCDVQFDTHRLLQLHIRTHLDKDTKETDDKDLETIGENGAVSNLTIIRESEMLNNETESTSAIICAVCGGSATFDDLEALHKHMTDEHNVTGTILPNGRIATSTFSEIREDRIYKCSKCGKVFRSLGILKRHETTHDPDKPFYCKFGTCRWEFSTQAELSLHAISNHAGKKKCPVCLKQFNSKLTFKQHMISHRNNDRFTCKFCGRGFNYRLHLRNHESTHTTDKPYLCPQCGKRCRIKELYRVHMLLHKKRPHQCNLCPKSFIMPSLLKKHTEQCDVLCQMCGVQLRSQRELTKHLREHRQNLQKQCGARTNHSRNISNEDNHLLCTGDESMATSKGPSADTSDVLKVAANSATSDVSNVAVSVSTSNVPSVAQGRSVTLQNCGAGTNNSHNISNEDNHWLCTGEESTTMKDFRAAASVATSDVSSVATNAASNFAVSIFTSDDPTIAASVATSDVSSVATNVVSSVATSSVTYLKLIQANTNKMFLIPVVRGSLQKKLPNNLAIPRLR